MDWNSFYLYFIGVEFTEKVWGYICESNDLYRTIKCLSFQSIEQQLENITDQPRLNNILYFFFREQQPFNTKNTIFWPL